MSVEWDNLDQVGRAEMTGYQAGQKAERERIIKLLEKHDKETRAGSTDLAIKYRSAVLACIALIKEDNK